MLRLQRVFTILILIGSLVFTSKLYAQKDSCIECHRNTTPKVVDEYQISIHSQGDIGCSDCHGGNKKAASKEGAHDRSFRGVPDRKEIPKFCGDCHSNVERMKFYRLDTNIIKEYYTSMHGIKLKEGDRNVAVCTDCHGTHSILSKHNKKSPSNRYNIVNTCAKCHDNKNLMKKYNIPGNEVKEYKEGIHGSILIGKKKGDPNLVPTCVDCHGLHGAKPPEVTSIPAVCGTCHNREYSYFKLSAHYEAMRLSGSPQCVTCHGNHNNRIPEGGLFKKSDGGAACTKCHEEGQRAYQIARSLEKALDRGLKSFAKVKTLYEKEKKNTIVETQYRVTQQRISKLRAVVHSLDVKMAMALANKIESDTKTAIRFIEKEREKEDNTIFIVGLIVALIATFIFSFFIATRITKSRMKKTKTD